MIEIKPTISESFNFPKCLEEHTVVEDIVFTGTHTLAKCCCSTSERRFYHTFPTGHTLQLPVAFSEDGHEKYYSPEAEEWLAEPLIASFLSYHTAKHAEISRIVRKKYTQVVVLNCLDNCYGHCLYKLFNAEQHLLQHPELGLILLIPKSLLWLVPEGTAEVWCVNVPLRQLKQCIPNLDAFIKMSIQDFDKVYLSRAITQLNTYQIDTQRFTKISAFRLDNFLKADFQITFITREDRFWLTSSIDFLLYLASVKFHCLSLTRYYFVYKQNRLINKVTSQIQKQLVTAQVFVTGIGRTGKFERSVIDRRVPDEVSIDIEKEWGKLYSTSQIVVGVHGSNMLIPTSLAGSYIILVPDYKIEHWGEDVVVRHSVSNVTYLGRFLSPFSPPKRVTRNIVQLFKGFSRHCFKDNAPVSLAIEALQKKTYYSDGQ